MNNKHTEHIINLITFIFRVFAESAVDCNWWISLTFGTTRSNSPADISQTSMLTSTMKKSIFKINHLFFVEFARFPSVTVQTKIQKMSLTSMDSTNEWIQVVFYHYIATCFRNLNPVRHYKRWDNGSRRIKQPIYQINWKYLINLQKYLPKKWNNLKYSG